MNVSEKPLPHNAARERNLLGALLVGNPLSAAILAVPPDNFFLRANRIIFSALCQMNAEGIPLNSVNLLEHLDQEGNLEDVGGAGSISSLGSDQILGVPGDVPHDIRTLEIHAISRRLAYLGQELTDAALCPKPNDTLEGIINRYEDRLRKIKEIAPAASWEQLFHAASDFEASGELAFSIENFLQNNSATVIAGLSGHGKTLAMLSIVAALLRGRGSRLWEHFAVRETAARVLYLIPESTIESFKHRLGLFGLLQYVGPDDPRLFVRTLSLGPTPCLSDARILAAARGAHVFLDTAVRFQSGDENNAADNQRGLASDIFALLGAGARTVVGAHHAPKPFARENTMSLENVLRGSGDIGAMVGAAFGVKQLSANENIVHIECLKSRDFESPGPFQLIGRPYINDEGDFRMHKRPGECGTLMDEQEPERNKGGGAPEAVREARAANLALMRRWVTETPNLSSRELSRRFANEGITVGDSAIRRYRKNLGL